MSPRQYRLGARAAAVTDTRRRVVAAAAEAFATRGFHGVSLDDVARRADVARATVYHQFGSKLGLLDAVITDVEQRSGLARLVELIENTPEPQLLAVVITAGCRYWATDPALVRTIIATAATDPAAAQMLERRDQDRRALLQRMVKRLSEAHLLSTRTARQHALDTLWLVTSFAAYDELTRGNKRSTAAAARTLVAIAEQQLLSATAEVPRGDLPVGQL